MTDVEYQSLYYQVTGLLGSTLLPKSSNLLNSMMVIQYDSVERLLLAGLKFSLNGMGRPRPYRLKTPEANFVGFKFDKCCIVTDTSLIGQVEKDKLSHTVTLQSASKALSELMNLG